MQQTLSRQLRKPIIANHPSSRQIVARLLMCSDVVGLIACLNISVWLVLGKSLDWFSPLLYGLICAHLVGLYLADAYRMDIRLAGLWSIGRVLVGIFIASGLITTGIYALGLLGNNPLAGRGVFLLNTIMFVTWAMLCRLVAVYWSRRSMEASRWLVLGASENIAKFEREYRERNPKATIICLATSERNYRSSNISDVGTLEDFEAWTNHRWSGIVIDGQKGPLSDAMVRQLMHLRLQGTNIYSLEEFYELLWRKIPPSFVRDDWFAFTNGFSLIHNRINVKLKRCVDLAASVTLLILMLPLMGLVALLIKLESPGPIFYSQIRTGIGVRPFQVHKFRSMFINAESEGAQWASKADSRITRVGRVIRILRIDELPQLWNVLWGEMSLIGPRPERPEFDQMLEQQIPYYTVRYLVKPGITGWAQVMYPYGASVQDAYRKVAYDLYYIKNHSLLLDMSIALKTLKVIFLGKGR